MPSNAAMPAHSWCDVCRSDSGRADKSLRFQREGAPTESRGRDMKCERCGKILATYALKDPSRKRPARD